MTKNGRDEASKSQLALAEEEVRAARTLLAADLPRAAVSRADFAALHAARGRLYAEQLEPRTHTGVRHLYSEHFVKTGRSDPGDARLLARLSKLREEADYAREFFIDNAGAEEELGGAADFVARVREALA